MANLCVGLTDCLLERVDEKYFPEPLIPLCFNIDGLPLFKSSSVNFWPILCQIYDTKYEWKPFPVAIFCGVGKPGCVSDFLKEFVEINYLLLNGITIKNRHYDVVIRSPHTSVPGARESHTPRHFARDGAIVKMNRLGRATPHAARRSRGRACVAPGGDSAHLAPMFGHVWRAGLSRVQTHVASRSCNTVSFPALTLTIVIVNWVKFIFASNYARYGWSSTLDDRIHH